MLGMCQVPHRPSGVREPEASREAIPLAFRGRVSHENFQGNHLGNGARAVSDCRAGLGAGSNRRIRNRRISKFSRRRLNRRKTRLARTNRPLPRIRRSPPRANRASHPARKMMRRDAWRVCNICRARFRSSRKVPEIGFPGRSTVRSQTQTMYGLIRIRVPS